MVEIEKILRQVDGLFEQNKKEEAERLMQQAAAQAVQEQDDGSLLQLLNELLGYYRETGQEENALRMAEQAVSQAGRMGLEGTIPYATTLLNVASACRVFGRLEESMGYYLQVRELYDGLLEPESMFMAGLKNNMALLYQEKGDYHEAKRNLLEALDIVEKKGAAYEIGVSCANLASTCMQLNEPEAAYEYGMKSMETFRRAGVMDNHFAAAQSALGAYFFQKGEFAQAGEYYRQAMETVEKCVGRNGFYERLRENLAACERALQGTEGEGGSCGLPKGRPTEGNPQEKGRSEPERENRSLDGRSEPERANRSQDGGSEDNKQASAGKDCGRGLSLAREYYEAFGRPMIESEFPDYAEKIAVGLAGGGSDCFGYDDEASRDHDWGPDFCMWVTDETYEEIGEALERAYQGLPQSFKGYERAPRINGRGRRGVIRISDFFGKLLGAAEYEGIDWRQARDWALAAAVNGEVFRDDEGIFTAFRERLKEGYPEEIRYLKLAEAAAGFAQTAQYNYPRMLGRGDGLAAGMMIWDGIKEAMRLQHYIEGKYPPHDKWLHRSLQESQEGRETARLIALVEESLTTGRDKDVSGSGGEGDERDTSVQVERLAAHFVGELYAGGWISDTETYLDAHSQELVYKASLGGKSIEELAGEIASLEFEAFDKVKNQGGRASCQDDWGTFSIMRKSQYLTWNGQMLRQYLYDFQSEYRRGHNLIEEKYGRMMESTAPEEFEKIKGRFPVLTAEKKAIIEQIVGMQVKWMEEFAGEYPALAGNARKIHTWEDEAFDTSYETYLRGELGTYSDKMLELYGRYIVEYARSERNPAYDIMENSVKMYGYADMEEAEREVGAQ